MTHSNCKYKNFLFKKTLALKAPKEKHDDHVWLSVSSTHPLYWNRMELPQLGVGNCRIDVIKKIHNYLGGFGFYVQPSEEYKG